MLRIALAALRCLLRRIRAPRDPRVALDERRARRGVRAAGGALQRVAEAVPRRGDVQGRVRRSRGRGGHRAAHARARRTSCRPPSSARRFLLEQKDLARPLWQVAGESGVALRRAGARRRRELLDAQGRLLALPLGRATPVLYYNRDAFRIAMLDPAKPPATWYEMVPTLAALVASGSDCALTIAWPASALLENMAAWHNQAFATDRLMFNNRLAVRWVSTLATWQKSGYFTHAARRGEAEARFAAGECALLAASSATTPSCAARAIRPRHRAVSVLRRFRRRAAQHAGARRGALGDGGPAGRRLCRRGALPRLLRPARGAGGVAPAHRPRAAHRGGLRAHAQAGLLRRNPGHEIAVRQLLRAARRTGRACAWRSTRACAASSTRSSSRPGRARSRRSTRSTPR